MSTSALQRYKQNSTRITLFDVREIDMRLLTNDDDCIAYTQECLDGVCYEKTTSNYTHKQR